MKRGPDQATIYRIARSYYKDGLSQDEIARREGFSRSQISRLVDKAREMGMVRIELVPPSGPRSGEIEALERALGLSRIVVAPQAAQADGASVARTIASAAADYLAGAMADFEVVGLGWGKTVYAASELLPYEDRPGERLFVPLVGTSGDDDPSLQINTIIDRFSAKFKAKGLFVNAQAVREKGGSLTRIERERITHLRSLWRKVEMAVVGLGEPPSRSSNFIAELSASTRGSLRESGAVGDILGQFFHADGSVIPIEEGYERLAFDLRSLGSLKRVTCLAGGSAKVAGIAAAARAGFITELVTDESTAAALRELVLPAAGAAPKAGAISKAAKAKGGKR